MYPTDLIAIMEAELTDAGFVPLKTRQQVTNHFENHKGTTLLVLNSMCGCAGPDARMGAIEALATTHYQPDHLVTVFPGVDQEATLAIQQYIQPYPLSSPAIAVIKDGEVIHFMERHQIKGKPAELVAAELSEGLVESCSCDHHDMRDFVHDHQHGHCC